MEELAPHGPVFLIEVDKIVPNPQQPRREFDEAALNELAQSIQEVGLIQPIVVSKIEKETESGTEVVYQLIAGERRWLASKRLGLPRIPAIVKQVDVARERLELALIENIQRANLNPIEEARAYAKFQDEFGMTQREVATRVGKSREVIANALRLLQLPTEIQDALSHGRLSESQGRLLLSITDPAEQKRMFEETLTGNLSVRELKRRIEAKAGMKHKESHDLFIDPEAAALQKELEAALHTKVHVERSGTSGKITISFFSPEELQAITERILARQERERAAEDFSLSTVHPPMPRDEGTALPPGVSY